MLRGELEYLGGQWLSGRHSFEVWATIVCESLRILEKVLAKPIGFGIVDSDLRYRNINETLANMNGLPARDHLGKRIPDLFPGLEAVMGHHVQTVLDSASPLTGIEFVGPSPTRHSAPGRWHVSYCPVRSASKAIGIAAIVIDLTDHEESVGATQACQASADTGIDTEALANCASRFGFTQRERSVFLELAGGRANKEIAARLGCSLRTVEVHVSSLLRKSNCSSRAELLARLLKLHGR